MTQADDLAEFENLSRHKRKKICWAQALETQLDKSEREQLYRAMDEPLGVISNAGISKWLKQRGVSVSWQAVRTHRIDECECFDD